MGGEYDATKSRSYVLYWDANNLYGKAMSSYLPTHEYEWVDNTPAGNLPLLSEIQDDPAAFIQGLNLEGSHGYLYEVDMVIPQSIHDKLNDLPPAPSRRSLDSDALSSAYQEPLLENLGQDSTYLRTKKLIADLHPKKNYIAHSTTLKQYILMGVQITKVHKVLRFQQSAWMKSFIDFNTEKRKRATNDFEKDFWKLLNNSAFGKTIEQKRY